MRKRQSRMSRKIVVASAICLSILSGCGINPQRPAAKVSELQLGMAKTDVQQTIGEPDELRALFRSDEGEEIEVWKYRLRTISNAQAFGNAVFGVFYTITWWFPLFKDDIDYMLYFRRGELSQWHREGARPSQTDSPSKQKSARTERVYSFGSGFIVSAKGDILTNNHVVDGCIELHALLNGQFVEGRIVRQDPENDLALLKISSEVELLPLPFRAGKRPRAGEEVVAIGYPLMGLLGREQHVTNGTISALSGINDDSRFLQISAPVQPGNSGGPLLDLGGNVVGVVVGKLNAVRMAKVTGDIPQNVNFAIHGLLGQAFLESNNIEYTTRGSSDRHSIADIAEKSKGATLQVQCVK